MTKVDGNTVTIEKADRSVETVSRSRVVLAPKPASEEEVEKLLKPIDLPEEIASEQTNLNDIVAGNDKDDNEVAKQTEGIDAETTNATQEEQTKKNDAEENETEEHVMDSIVDDKVNKSRRHRYAKYGETLYRVRWYDCGPEEDTWEPIRHLPRSKVLSYCRR